jgi:hypothetical protein
VAEKAKKRRTTIMGWVVVVKHSLRWGRPSGDEIKFFD